MREVDCPCGLTLTGADDDELFARGREHADEQHTGDGITDEFIRTHGPGQRPRRRSRLIVNI